MTHLRGKFLGRLLGPHSLALLDQAVISGLGFVTIIMIGRWTNPTELGLYAIGFSILLSLQTVQWTLISLPYMVQRRCPLGTAAELAGSTLVQCGLLLTLTTFLLTLAALGLVAHGAKPELAALMWTLAGAAPFIFLREFRRWFAFAHLHAGRALRLDIAVATIQLVTLGWLAWTGRLSSSSAYAAIGVACALPSILWLYRARSNVAVRMGQLRANMKRSWALGKWTFAVQITAALQVYFAFSLLAWLAGTRATGIYAAIVTVATLCNPLILGLGNVLVPKAVLAFNDGSLTKLRREIRWDLLLRAAPIAVFCLVVVFAGEDLLYLFYRSDDYTGYGYAAAVLTFSVLIHVIGMPAWNALISMGQPREVFWVELSGATLTVALTWLLVRGWDVLGVAYAHLAGNLIRATGWWIVFLVVATSYDKFAKTSELGSTAVAGRRVQEDSTGGVNVNAYSVPGS
jgi:O-antigen/teichoic acid export membrane protein